MNNMNDKKCKTCGGALASTERSFHRDCQSNALGFE